MSAPESVSKVKLLPSGAILLCLASGGRADYQYVYRAAKGVYWDNESRGFTMYRIGDWSPTKQLAHILRVVDDEMAITLGISEATTWDGLSIEEIDSMNHTPDLS
jgi:hypothetical protein